MELPISSLLERLANEYEAHIFYRNASNWCAVKGFSYASKYFADEAKSELTHADAIQEYLTNWNISFSIPSVSVEFDEFTSIRGLFLEALEIEQALYKAYNKDAIECMHIDSSLYNLNLKFVGVQTEAVAEYLNFNDELKMISDSDLWLWQKENFGE